MMAKTMVSHRSVAMVTLLALASALPFLFAGAIETRDASNHIARIHILADGAANADLVRGYVIEWRWIGNLGVDLPAILLGRWIGIEPAVTLLTAVIAPLTVLGLWLLSREAYGRLTGPAALALPLAISQLFLWGFLNFSLSVALAMIAAAMWRRSPPRGIVGALGFGLAAIAIWTSHVMGWAGLLLMIAGFELAQGWRRLPHRILIGLPMLTPLVPMLLWRNPDAAPLFQADGPWLMSKVMNFATILRGTWKPVDLAMVAIIGIAAFAVIVTNRRLDRQYAFAAALLLLAAILLPPTVMGSWGADIRMTPWAVSIALLAIMPAGDRIDRPIVALGIALFLIRIAAICALWQGQAAVHKPQLALVDKVPRGARMAYAYVQHDCGTPWSIGPERQLGSLAIARRDTTTNTMFWIRGADLVEMARPSDRGRWTNGSQEIAIADCPSGQPQPERARAQLVAMAHDFDWIWIVADRGIAPDSLPIPPGMTRVAAAPGSLLLRR